MDCGIDGVAGGDDEEGCVAYSSLCFPPYALVEMAPGSTATIDSLRIGDNILAAHQADGALFYDEVTSLSIADHNTTAKFLTLTTDDGFSLTMTPTHHVPVGDSCCATVVMAKDVVVGDTLYVVDSGVVAARTVTASGAETYATGLFNPLLKHGGLPVVNGVVTSFNDERTVAFESFYLPYITELCESTGTWLLFKRAHTALSCVGNHLGHFAKNGKLAQGRLCKTFRFIDGSVVHAGSVVARADNPQPVVGMATVSLTAGITILAAALIARRTKQLA